MKASQQSGVLIYAVGLLSEEERREAKRAQRALKALAEATGGEVFFPKEVAEVDRIAHQVAHDIRNQYTIEYSPTNTALDGTFRQIKITVNAPGNPTVRTRSGYYATPDQAGPHGCRSQRAGHQTLMRSLYSLSAHGGLVTAAALAPAGAAGQRRTRRPYFTPTRASWSATPR